MKLDLVIDAEDPPWRPTPEWTTAVERLVAGVGPDDACLQVVLTGDELVQQLNAQYRSKDQPTDVLSFSYVEEHRDHRHEMLQGRIAAAPLLDEPHPVEDEDRVLGEVVVSIDTVARRDNPGSVDEEMFFMVVHGLLHVLGFDHGDDAQADEMQAAEQALVRTYGLRAEARGGEGR